MDRIASLEKEIAVLRDLLDKKEKELYELRQEHTPFYRNVPNETDVDQHPTDLPLAKWAIERYSRQILLPSIGPVGQSRLCGAKVLIVGAGGLGCPAALYLAAAGVGEIGIVDYDTVDLTNLHRQVLHGECDQGISKVESAVNALRRINSRIKVTPYRVQLSSGNAIDIARAHDAALDCTDNVPARYLLNDLCRIIGIPLISGSALKLEGQLTVYGYRADKNPREKDQSYRGPCYRCLFPTPPPPEAVGSCSADGVAGPVPGVIGVLQALEAIKLLVGYTRDQLLVGRMLLFDGDDSTFRTVKLRDRNPDCAVCSDNPSITQLVDYEQFCNARAKENKHQSLRQKMEAKKRRMTGRSYLGYRPTPDGQRKWIQDVFKSERKIGPACKSNNCRKKCNSIDHETRQNIFNAFWYDFDWLKKKEYVRSLIDSVPPKRRVVKNDISRKGNSKVYHLINKNNERVVVCRGMFLNTLAIKDATVRWWFNREITIKKPKEKIQSLKVDSYLKSLTKMPPKCQICRQNSTILYLNLDNNIKSILQLYKKYVKDMKSKGQKSASRKTFTKVFQLKNIKIFKPKTDTDLCDLYSDHNTNNVQNKSTFNRKNDDICVVEDQNVLPNTNVIQNFEINEIEGNSQNVSMVYVQW